MKKKICIVLAAVLVAVLLTACGGKDEPAVGGIQVQTPAATAAETTTPAATAAQTQAEPMCNEDDFVTESLEDGTCKLTAYHGDSAEVVVPEIIRGETVVEIAGVGTVGIKKVVLPDTVEVIGYQAFNYCPDLEEIVLGKGLKEVGYFAFNACDALTEIVFPEGMTTMSELALGICANLKEVYIPASVTEIGGLLFYSETMPDLVIVTPAGSAAEKHAQENGLKVKNP